MTADATVLVERPGRILTAHSVVGPDSGPVIVFEAGLGGDHASWDSVVPAVSALGTAVTYDRAGYGASEFASDGRGLPALADDLVAVCRAVAGGKPILLVGHSLGGRIVLQAARSGQLELAGLVLIEPAMDGVLTRFPKLARMQGRVFTIGSVLGPLGAFRLPPVLRALARTRTADPERVESLVAEVSRRAYWRLLRQEWAAVVQPMGPLDALTVPTVAMLADRWTDWGPRQTRLMGADSVDLLRQLRTELEQIAADNPQHSTVVVTNTTHNIPTDRPETVVAAVQTVLAARRRTQGARR